MLSFWKFFPLEINLSFTSFLNDLAVVSSLFVFRPLNSYVYSQEENSSQVWEYPPFIDKSAYQMPQQELYGIMGEKMAPHAFVSDSSIRPSCVTPIISLP